MFSLSLQEDFDENYQPTEEGQYFYYDNFDLV
jgi:hypothetical protein